MKVLKGLLRGVYYFCVGVNATYHDIKESLGGKRALRRMYFSTLSLTLVFAMVLLSGCGAQGEVASVSSSSQDAAVSQDVSVSQEAEVSQTAAERGSSQDDVPQVELTAGATKFVEMDAVQLASATQSTVQQYQQAAASATPASGNLTSWQKINADVKAWITIPNTNINYPIVYHTDTNYYLAKDYYKQYSKYGVIWFDGDTRFNAKGDLASTNTVILGHNWKNVFAPIAKDNPAHTHFEQLAAYHYEDWGLKHPYIYIKTPTGDHKYQVFAAFYTTLQDAQWWYSEFADTKATNPTVAQSKYVWPDAYKNMLAKALGKSQYDFGVSVSASDKIITLSTCTRILGAGDNQRFLVMAKKVS